MMKTKLFLTLSLLVFLLVSNPALADKEREDVRGYGGHDDCRNGSKIVKNGHIECKEHEDKKDDHDKKDDKEEKGDDKKVNVVTIVINKFISFLSKLVR